MLCRKCGANIPDTDMYCPSCGALRPAPPPGRKACAHCKSYMPKEAKVCPVCRKSQGISTVALILLILGIVIALPFVVIAATSVAEGYISASQESQKPITTTTAVTTTSQEYIESCEVVEYEELLRNTSAYIDRNLTYYAKVVQIAPTDNGTILRLAVSTNSSINSSNIILANLENLGNVIEGDLLTIYGTCQGSQSYESVLGATITLPYIDIWYYTELEPSRFITTDENGNQTFIFDNLSITISPQYTITSVDNQFSDYYNDKVIAVPVSITNISDETYNLFSGYVREFGSKGVSLDSVDVYFDDGRNIYDDLRPGATTQGHLYLLYDGDGDYCIEFQDNNITIDITYAISTQ